MNFHILTLFPDMVIDGLNTSITGRAIKENKMSVQAVNIRDFSTNKHKKVDDYTYGGGAGMLMQPQPVFDAWKSVENRIRDEKKGQASSGKKLRTIYVTPQGHTFNQRMAEDFAKEENLVILCGHYEGIDERVLEEVVTDYVSIGDYVLTGGELAAMVMVDAIARLVPGVLNNEVSAETESFHGDLLEYPQYSRPEVWHEKEVPKVLLSGNQKQIDAWRLEQAVLRTKERRPDLYEKYKKLQQCKDILMKQKLLHIDMIELINRGRAVLCYENKLEFLLKDSGSGIFMYTNLNQEAEESFWDRVKGKRLEDTSILEEIFCLVVHQEKDAQRASSVLKLNSRIYPCYQAVYTTKEKLPITGLYRMDQKPTEQGVVIHALSMADKDLVREYYDTVDSDAYVIERIQSGAMYGAYRIEQDKEILLGFIGMHSEGSIGMLTVLPQYRGMHIGKALETYLINEELNLGYIPYGQVKPGNEVSMKLQKSLGLYFSKTPVYWVE